MLLEELCTITQYCWKSFSPFLRHGEIMRLWCMLLFGLIWHCVSVWSSLSLLETINRSRVWVSGGTTRSRLSDQWLETVLHNLLKRVYFPADIFCVLPTDDFESKTVNWGERSDQRGQQHCWEMLPPLTLSKSCTRWMTNIRRGITFGIIMHVRSQTLCLLYNNSVGQYENISEK